MKKIVHILREYFSELATFQAKLKEVNALHSNLQFTPEHEAKREIPFLNMYK